MPRVAHVRGRKDTNGEEKSKEDVAEVKQEEVEEPRERRSKVVEGCDEFSRYIP